VLQCVAVCWTRSCVRIHVIIEVCCSVLQCVAVFYSVLQCVAMCCNVLQCVAVCWTRSCASTSSLRCVAVCCSVLQCVAVCCSVLQCVAVCCSEFYKILRIPVMFPSLSHTRSSKYHHSTIQLTSHEIPFPNPIAPLTRIQVIIAFCITHSII